MAGSMHVQTLDGTWLSGPSQQAYRRYGEETRTGNVISSFGEFNQRDKTDYVEDKSPRPC